MELSKFIGKYFELFFNLLIIMGFGKEIRRLRIEANKISVDKIAGKVGVDAGRWRKWEEKDLTPRQEDATKLEEFFEMSLDQLMQQKSIKKFLSVPNSGNEKMAIGLDRESMAKEILHLKAVVKAQGDLLIKLASEYYKRELGDVKRDLNQSTRLIMLDQEGK